LVRWVATFFCTNSNMQRPISSSRLGSLLPVAAVAAILLGVSQCFFFRSKAGDGATFVVGVTPAMTARGLASVSHVDGVNYVGATYESHQGSTMSSATASFGLLLGAAVVALGLRAATGSRVAVMARAHGRRVRLQAAKSETEALAEVSEDEDDDEEYDDLSDDEDASDLLGYDDDDDELYASDGEEDRLEAMWHGKHMKGSVWKYRRVLWQIRGRSYRDALILLEFLPWRACKVVLTGLQSAAANAQNQLNMDKSRLYVSRCQAIKGPISKRMRPAAKGQPHMYVKRTSFIKIWVAEMADEELDSIAVR